MTNSSTERLVRTCYHEAGHALVAVVLGVPVGPVTVQPCASFRGCALTYHHIDLTDADNFLHLSPQRWPPDVRQQLENYLLIKFGGPTAATMAPGESASDPFAYEHLATPDLDWPGPAGLTPGEANALAIEAAAPAAPSDCELIASMAWLAFGGRERAAWRHSRWLAEETRLLLERHAAALARVADALLAHRVLGGRDVKRLVNGG